MSLSCPTKSIHAVPLVLAMLLLVAAPWTAADHDTEFEYGENHTFDNLVPVEDSRMAKAYIDPSPENWKANPGLALQKWMTLVAVSIAVVTLADWGRKLGGW